MDMPHESGGFLGLRGGRNTYRRRWRVASAVLTWQWNGKWAARKETGMGQFDAVMRDTFIITTRLGLPVVILFLIGYMIRMRYLYR